MKTILTDADGVPVEAPEPPPPGASIEEKIAYIRARHAHTDRLTDLANGAFDKAFRAALKTP